MGISRNLPLIIICVCSDVPANPTNLVTQAYLYITLRAATFIDYSNELMTSASHSSVQKGTVGTLHIAQKGSKRNSQYLSFQLFYLKSQREEVGLRHFAMRSTKLHVGMHIFCQLLELSSWFSSLLDMLTDVNVCKLVCKYFTTGCLQNKGQM